MRKIAILILMVAIFAPAMVFAGGIVTNTNQSATFIRMPAQDATISVDGVYYNPAGLVHLSDGFHLSLSNQYVTQTRTIESTYAMNQQKFEGDVLAPLFPTFYAVYKKGKTAYSFGVNPIGGGGSANFESGLPSFEQQVAVLPGLLTLSGIPTSEYSVQSAFDGQSLNWGFQFNASYALTDMVSVSLGFRFVMANNSYNGYLKNLMINPNQPAFGAAYNGTSLVSAPQFFNDASATFNGWALGANSYYAGLQPIIDGGGGTVLLSNGTGVGLTAEQVAQIQGLIMAAGQDPTGLDIQTAQAILGAAAPAFSANAANMDGFAALTADKEVDAAQSGYGIAPIVGVNFKFSENLNVALKYEHKVDMIMTNETVVDDVNLYPDGAKTPNDMPSMLAVGVGYKPISKLYLSGGLHYYFDKSANYGKKIAGEFVDNEEVIDKNFLEVGLGLEYTITDKILVSAGYLLTQTGVNDDYHSDLSHSLSTNSFGVGGKYILNENLGINIGYMNTMYKGYTKEFTGYEETYNRKAMVIALGLDYKF